MKRVYILFLISVLLIGAAYYLTYLLKQRTVAKLSSDLSKVTMYKKWGYDTAQFEQLYLTLIAEAKNTSPFLLPLRVASLNTKHDNTLRLAQAGYATEMNIQKEALKSRLSYLRSRVKNMQSLSVEKKQIYFNSFEVVAGQGFEMDSSIADIKGLLSQLSATDTTITKEVEAIRRESLISELQGYKATCEDLYLYFKEKKSL